MPKKRFIEKVGRRLSRLNTSAEERISILRAIKLCVDTGSIGVIDACDMFALSTTAYYNWKRNPYDEDKRKSESRSEKYIKVKPVGQRPARKNHLSISPDALAIVESQVREAEKDNMTISEAHMRLLEQNKAVASLSTYYRVAREIGVKPKKTP